MKTIYLAGHISTEAPQTLSWRTEAHRLLRSHFHLLSPLRGKDLTKDSGDGGLTCTKTTSRDILLRDYYDIKLSDILLVNLAIYESSRPLIGTIAELAWAWEQRKVVVGVIDLGKQGALMANHPFVSEFVTHYFPSLEPAAEFLKEYHK